MRTCWLGLIGLTFGLIGCLTTDQQLKPPKPVPEYNLPPKDDPRFSNPPSFPEKLLNNPPKKDVSPGPAMGPGGMGGPSKMGGQRPGGF